MCPVLYRIVLFLQVMMFEDRYIQDSDAFLLKSLYCFDAFLIFVVSSVNCAVLISLFPLSVVDLCVEFPPPTHKLFSMVTSPFYKALMTIFQLGPKA